MEKVDLHDEFVKILSKKIPKRSELVNLISDILLIEKESASRRLNGRVLFSVREIGFLAKNLNISLDYILNKRKENLWVQQKLGLPMKSGSMDQLCDMIYSNLKTIIDITKDKCMSGCAYNSLPMEFFLPFPTLRKFMFFKWGHYFIGTDEFYQFSSWKLPPKLEKLPEVFKGAHSFDQIFYIWDSSLIWTLAEEITNHYKMHIITTEEKEDMKEELRYLLKGMEDYLKGISNPGFGNYNQMNFYLSNMNIGFTGNYCASEHKYFGVFQTNFSYAPVDGSYENFCKLKEWIDSLRQISILLSHSAGIERRLFFEKQLKIVEAI